MSDLVLAVYFIVFLFSSCMYSCYYGKAESIVCIRIHLQKMPMADYYHLVRLFDKIGLFLMGSSFTLSVMWLIWYWSWFKLIVFVVWLFISAAWSYWFFNKAFDGTGSKLLEIDETWKFTTHWKWLDELLGFDK